MTCINMLAECRWVAKGSLALIALIMPCATQMLWQGAFRFKFSLTYPAFKCHKSTSMFNLVPFFVTMLLASTFLIKWFPTIVAYPIIAWLCYVVPPLVAGCALYLCSSCHRFGGNGIVYNVNPKNIRVNNSGITAGSIRLLQLLIGVSEC
jgi:hypothetical protein